MKRISIAGLALATALLTACGGGGSSSSGGPAVMPPGPGGSVPTSRDTMTFQMRIPLGGSSQSQRRPGFISPNTASIGVVERDQGASSANPAVYVNVSSCPVVSGVATCSITVAAKPGSDSFTITTYSAQNGGGSVLGTGSLVFAVVAGVANVTQPVTLGGAVATMAFAPGSTTLPLGQTETLNIAAKDASGALIAGPYSNGPIALSGSSFAFSAPSIANSADASTIAVSWALGFDGSAAQTLTATTSDNKTGSAQLIPGSGLALYNVGSNVSTDNGGFKMIQGPDGKLYFSSIGPTSCSPNSICTAGGGAIHQFDPITHATSEIATPGEVVGLTFDHTHALWVAGGPGNNVYYIPNATSSFTAAQSIPLPAKTGVSVRALAEDGSGNMWAVDGSGRRLIKIPIANPPTTASMTVYNLPNGGPGTPQYWAGGYGIYYAPDGMLYIMDRNNGAIDQFVPGIGAFGTQFPFPQNASLASNDSAAPYDMFGANGVMYMGYTGSLMGDPSGFGGVESFATSTHSFARYPMPSDVANQGGSTGLAGSTLYFNDFAQVGLGVTNISTSKTRLYPMDANGVANAAFPDGLVAMSDGSAWTSCYSAVSAITPPALCVGHTVYQNGWSVWPTQTLQVWGAGPANEQLVGLMEAPSADSGPFTAVSNNTSVCTISGLSDHNFNIVGASAGACTVTVTDAHSVSKTINVVVTTTTATITSHGRKSTANKGAIL